MPTEKLPWHEARLQSPNVRAPLHAPSRPRGARLQRQICPLSFFLTSAVCAWQIHKQHVFADQFPETRKLMMRLHAKRSAEFEYLKPQGKPIPFDFEKSKDRCHNIVDAVAKDPPVEGMRMVLLDGKWRMAIVPPKPSPPEEEDQS